MKRLFFDIETSYDLAAVWRCGREQSIDHYQLMRERAIICICYKWEGKKVQHLEWNNGCDAQLVRDFIEILNEADEIVAHNGDKFDLKWFVGRCIFHRVPAFPQYKTIDTLKMARKHFNLNSNRLDYIGKYLRLGGKVETGGFQLWVDICEHNCPKAMKKMVRYCKRDVDLLEKVFGVMKPYVSHKTHQGVLRVDCPECASRNTRRSKTTTTATKLVRYQMKCNDCGKYWTIPQKVFEGEATLDQYGAA